MKQATLVNIYGTDRSGSTMLDLMLGNAPDAFSCGEVSAWFRPYRKHHARIDCLCGQELCPWAKLKDVRESDFHATTAHELNVRFVIDSSKDVCWLIDSHGWAHRNGLSTVNLLIWKDPIDLAYSYWKRGRRNNAWRHTFVKCHGRFLELGLPFTAIQYDDLARSPSQVIERLCAVTGMDYFEGKARFWEKQHHHLFGSGGVRIQVGSGESLIENKKSYPDAFEKQRHEIRERVEQDMQMQDILRQLKKADLMCGTPAPNGGTTVLPPTILPSWYYCKKMVRWIRRYIPEAYDNAVAREVETVPSKRSP
jgi:hypothetical protein